MARATLDYALADQSRMSWPGALPNRIVNSLSDQEAFTLIRWKVTDSDSGRDTTQLRLQREWFRNIRFFLGIQGSNSPHDFIDQDMGGFLDEVSQGFTANLLARIVAGQVSRLSQAKPDASVMPKSADIEDQEGARVGQFFLDHWDDVFNYRKLRRDLSMWLTTCGTGFVWRSWDPNGGSRYTDYNSPFNDQKIDGLDTTSRETLERIGSSKSGRKGAMEMEVFSPFQVQVPSPFIDQERMPWMLLEREVSLDWIWDHYPDKAASVVPEDADGSFQGQYYRRLHSLVSRGGFTQGRSGDDSESVTVREFWMPPSGRVPKGLRIVATRSVLLENGPHPFASAGLDLDRFPSLRFPVTRFRYLPVPGRYWGKSLVEDLIDPQREYNRAREQVQAMRDVLATPQWLSPDTAELASTRNDYGDIWVYKNRFGGKPERIDPPPMSSMHQETIERAVSDLQMISAQSDASQAQVPEGVRSGVALRALQEQDMMVVGPTIEEMEDGWRDVMVAMLGLTWKFVDEPVAITTYGDSRMADVHIFKGEDLNGNMQVRIRPGSMTPKSQAAMQQQMLDMVQMGILQPQNPEHDQIIMKTMEVGGTDELFFDRNADRRRANIENYMFRQPSESELAPWPDVDPDDDHMEHVKEHLRFKKTDAYELLPLAHKIAFEAHMEKHRRAVAQMMEAQMLLSGGGPGGGGGGGSAPRETGNASQPRERQPTPGTEGKER